MSLSENRRRLLLPIPVAAVAVTVTASAAMAGPAALEWTNTKTPELGGQYALADVHALAADDVWSVGSTNFNGGGRGVALHWDGDEWGDTELPTDTTKLEEVTAIAGEEVWTVGAADDGRSTFAARWDGQAWRHEPAPQPEIPGEHTVSLRSIGGAAVDDVWAVGNSSDIEYGSVPFIQHWNGKEWTLVDVPALPDGAVGAGLTAVRVRAADDVWVVGGSFDAQGALDPLLLHWDGTAWSVQPAPVDDAGVYDIDFTEDGRIWLAGSTFRDGDTFDAAPMLMVGDGDTWNKLDVPSESRALSAIEPDGTGTVVAVGDGDGGAMVMRSDGETVTEAAAPPVDPGTDYSSLEGVSRVPGSQVLWTVGFLDKFAAPLAAHSV